MKNKLKFSGVIIFAAALMFSVTGCGGGGGGGGGDAGAPGGFENFLRNASPLNAKEIDYNSKSAIPLSYQTYDTGEEPQKGYLGKEVAVTDGIMRRGYLVDGAWESGKRMVSGEWMVGIIVYNEQSGFGKFDGSPSTTWGQIHDRENNIPLYRFVNGVKDPNPIGNVCLKGSGTSPNIKVEYTITFTDPSSIVFNGGSITTEVNPQGGKPRDETVAIVNLSGAIVYTGASNIDKIRVSLDIQFIDGISFVEVITGTPHFITGNYDDGNGYYTVYVKDKPSKKTVFGTDFEEYNSTTIIESIVIGNWSVFKSTNPLAYYSGDDTRIIQLSATQIFVYDNAADNVFFYDNKCWLKAQPGVYADGTYVLVDGGANVVLLDQSGDFVPDSDGREYYPEYGNDVEKTLPLYIEFEGNDVQIGNIIVTYNGSADITIEYALFAWFTEMLEQIDENWELFCKIGADGPETKVVDLTHTINYTAHTVIDIETIFKFKPTTD